MKPTRVLAALAAAVIPVIGFATPAVADGPRWGNDNDMIHSSCGRTTCIIAPGLHSEITPHDIRQAESYYVGRGFNRNFIWYAPTGQRQFQSIAEE